MAIVLTGTLMEATKSRLDHTQLMMVGPTRGGTCINRNANVQRHQNLMPNLIAAH